MQALQQEIYTKFTMQRAKFSVGQANQVFAFVNSGFVLIKRPVLQTTEESARLTVVNTFILKHLENEVSSWRYNLWRVFNKVDNYENRHSLPLPLTKDITDVLNTTIGAIRPFLDSQLSKEAALVELNSLISMPGSLKQEMHSDIPFSMDNMLISGFIALKDVNLECGPTHLFAGSHTGAYHRRCPTQSITTYYGSDGMPEYVTDKYAIAETAEETAAALVAKAAPACYAILEAGDVLLFNTMLFHYGGANISALPRAMLSFSFQRNSVDGFSIPINGFTYHCHHSVKGKLSLQDFPNTTTGCKLS